MDLRPPPRSTLARRHLLATGAALPLAVTGLAGCGVLGGGGANPPDLRAEVPRADPDPPEGAGEVVVPFTARLLAAIDRTPVNAVCSPLSAQIALAMIGLGAAGATRTQMEEVLGAPMEDLAQGANTLDVVLAAVGDSEREDPNEEDPEAAMASLANATWIQEGFEVSETFLEDLATYFGSGIHEADFVDDGEREQARTGINDWVLERTNDLIEELIPQGALSADTRLVLVNALHLKAAWQEPLTRSGGRFTTADGEDRSAEMLTGRSRGWYEDDLVRATSLPTYGDELALALIQPVQDVPTVIDGWASAAGESGGGNPGAGIGALLRGLQEEETGGTQLTVPAFDIDWEQELKDPLQQLGMVDAFTGSADFSGVTTETSLAITHVLQKAVITVDEEGMEAAAATAVIVGETSAPVIPNELILDAPFLFVAYETTTLAPLVLGWIGDPTQTR
jgi:serpin B